MIDLACTFALVNSHIMVNWQLSKLGIRWPESHDHIAGSSAEIIEGHEFLKVNRWPGYGFLLDRRLKYFHKLLEQGKKFETPLLDLAKSMH